MTSVTVIYVRWKYYSQTKPVLKGTEFLRVEMLCVYSKVHRLRCECDMKSHIELFVELKGTTFPPVGSHHWMFHFGVCIDITEHGMNWTSTCVQNLYHFVNPNVDKVTTLGRRLWDHELQLGNIWHTSQFWEPKGSVILRDLFFNKNLVSGFKIIYGRNHSHFIFGVIRF